MKVRSIRLRKIKRFEDQEISFYDELTNRIRTRTVIVGKNGSGKTTILDVIYGIITLMERGISGFEDMKYLLTAPAGSELRFEFDLGSEREKVLVKSGSLAKRDPKTDISMYIVKPIPLGAHHPASPDVPYFNIETGKAEFLLEQIHTATAGLEESPSIGNLLYFPTDRTTHFDVKGNLVNERPDYVWTYRYDREHRDWKGSLESYLCWLYFRDMKMKQDKPHHVSKFEELRDVVNLFLEGKKITTVDLNYRVVVEDVSGKKYGLEALSSGEKQIVMLIGEIYRHIVKRSLLLIDEPELHLHPVWQRVFIEVLTRLCDKYDAQMILTTQSPRIAESVLDSEIVSLDDLLEESNG